MKIGEIRRARGFVVRIVDSLLYRLAAMDGSPTALQKRTRSASPIDLTYSPIPV